MPAPYWVSYPGYRPVRGRHAGVRRRRARRSGLQDCSPEQLEAAITPKTKWLILNSPSNPSGAAYTAAELKALGEVLLRHPQVWIMADDMYEHIVYGDFAVRDDCARWCPELYERTLTVNGCSKAYSMTGWRIGFAGGPVPIIKAMSQAAVAIHLQPLLDQPGGGGGRAQWPAGFPRSRAMRRSSGRRDLVRLDAQPDQWREMPDARMAPSTSIRMSRA